MGFDSLPDQLVSKSVTQGFSFNILCVGKWPGQWQKEEETSWRLFCTGHLSNWAEGFPSRGRSLVPALVLPLSG